MIPSLDISAILEELNRGELFVYSHNELGIHTEPETTDTEPTPAPETATPENTTAAQTEPPTTEESENN